MWEKRQHKNATLRLSSLHGEMLETSTLAATTTSACSARLYQHMLGLLLCPAKSTLSNLICTRGGQYADWSADYRFYSKDRVEESFLFVKMGSVCKF